ncbi:DUF2059 domain-containing protein [Pontibaca salina]|uniref:DUF2059 domain-containing protein n=1 Tax=Pontibaca salina TaxID=2795731 RepID=A0A934HSQ5_9RHOB|nr:DUF2059 domain-containing protein [Pontibaca salina]MBI6630020.1 DUF2059 domain-containing protein [Pontibaca salina]
MQHSKHLPAYTRLSVRFIGVVALAWLFVLAAAVSPLRAAERSRVEAFLNITGFDVALDSIALSAGSAPGMLGLDDSAFGADWSRIAGQVFDTDVMHEMALDILEVALEEGPLNHAAAFYATDLGQRLVAAENIAHMAEDSVANEAEGRRIISDLVRKGAARLGILRRMNLAVGSSDSSLRALQEIQLRFLLAASAAGIIDMPLSAAELRDLLRGQEREMRRALQRSALAGAAWTYRQFSDGELRTYAEALEQPDMQMVYELLNAVQFEIMANRFEELAMRMAGLQEEHDI